MVSATSHLFSLVFAAALAACSHAPPAAVERPERQAPAAAPVHVVASAESPRLGIAPLTVYFNNSVAMTMRGDGTVRLADRDQPLFTVHADGRIVARDGSSGGLRADGHVVRADGSVSQGVYEADRLALGGRAVTLDERGILQVDGPPIAGTPPRVEGIIDPATRRTALLLVGIMLEAGLSGSTTSGY